MDADEAADEAAAATEAAGAAAGAEEVAEEVAGAGEEEEVADESRFFLVTRGTVHVGSVVRLRVRVRLRVFEDIARIGDGRVRRRRARAHPR